MLSSKGNSHIEQANAADLDSDVVGTLILNFFSFKPKLDSCGDLCGTEISHCYSMNPNGTLPTMIVDKLIDK